VRSYSRTWTVLSTLPDKGDRRTAHICRLNTDLTTRYVHSSQEQTACPNRKFGRCRGTLSCYYGDGHLHFITGGFISASPARRPVAPIGRKLGWSPALVAVAPDRRVIVSGLRMAWLKPMPYPKSVLRDVWGCLALWEGRFIYGNDGSDFNGLVIRGSPSGMPLRPIGRKLGWSPALVAVAPDRRVIVSELRKALLKPMPYPKPIGVGRVCVRTLLSPRWGWLILHFTQTLRSGLHSCAALRLSVDRVGFTGNREHEFSRTL
jgi:hypothetical protein